jgi:hypothetical protein
MKRILIIVTVSVLSVGFLYGQNDEGNESKYLIGFTGILPSGAWPSTALSNMGTGSFLKEHGNPVKSYGMGVIIQRKITDHINIFLDMNLYDYNIFLADKGKDVQTSWTESEGAAHWNESGAPQILYVHNLPTEVHFDMQTTGIRAGGRYLLLTKKIRPWIGAGFGYYVWSANYFNEDKSKTYGSDKGSAMGLTFQGGIDFVITPGIVLTAFADGASPVAHYQMEGLFYDQWDIDWHCPVMGTSRFGLALSFAPSHSRKK